MGIFRGPGVVNDGLVFGYDTGYNDSGEQLASGRFFKGPSHSNLLKGHANSQSSQTTNYSFVYGTQEVEIPEVGVRTVKYCDYNNNRYAADGSVNSGTSCCPNLFYYHGSSPYVPVSANTSYTYSIIYKHTAGYTHPNFMYRYEYNNTTYVKEGGLHSTASDRRRNLGNGWYHAWGTFTTASTTTNLRCYSFLYNYGLQTDRFYVAGISIVENQGGGTHFVIPPQLMLEPLGSVSDTASLIDLKRTTSIDVGDVSFDSNAQPTFDGTDDFLTVPSYSGFTVDTRTVEIIFKMNGSYSNFSPLAVYANGSSSSNRIWLGLQSSKFKMHGWGTVDPSGTTTIAADTWYVCTFSYNKSTQAMKMYTNGVLESTTTNTQGGVTAVSGMNWYLATIPGGWQSVTYSDVDIPSFKIYDRILSDAEVAQNFNSYKNRFNI